MDVGSTGSVSKCLCAVQERPFANMENGENKAANTI